MADRDVLTDGEIAALVEAAKQGETAGSPGSRSRRRRRIRDVDFTRPTKFTQEQQRKLERAHDNFCRLAASRLSAELRLAIDMQVIGIDQLTWSGAIADIPEPSISAVVELQPLQTRVLMSLEMSLVVRLIDRLLGGEGMSKPRPEGLTDIEITLARRIYSTLLDQLSVTWEEVGGLRLAMLELESKAANVHLAPPSEPTLRLTIEAKIDRFSSTLSLTIPYRAIEPIASKLQGGQFGEQGSDAHSREVMRATIAGVDVGLRAEAARVDLTLDEVLALEPGTLVPLGPGSSATLYVGAVPLYRVRPGRHGSHRAVEVVELLERTSR